MTSHLHNKIPESLWLHRHLHEKQITVGCMFLSFLSQHTCHSKPEAQLCRVPAISSPISTLFSSQINSLQNRGYQEFQTCVMPLLPGEISSETDELRKCIWPPYPKCLYTPCPECQSLNQRTQWYWYHKNSLRLLSKGCPPRQTVLFYKMRINYTRVRDHCCPAPSSERWEGSGAQRWAMAITVQNVWCMFPSIFLILVTDCGLFWPQRWSCDSFLSNHTNTVTGGEVSERSKERPSGPFLGYLREHSKSFSGLERELHPYSASLVSIKT